MLSLLAAATTSQRAGAQACTTMEPVVLYTSPRPLGFHPVMHGLVAGRNFGAWIEDANRVAVLDLEDPGGTPRYVAMPAVDLVALQEVTGGMLLLTHAPCSPRARTHCLFARTLDPEGNVRGALRSDAAPDRPQYVVSDARNREVAFGFTFQHATPMVVSYRIAPNGDLTSVTGGGRGRGRGRVWYSIHLSRSGDATRFLAWELVGEDGARTVVVQTGRPDALEILDIPEELAPVALRDTPSGALELVLRTDDQAFLAAEVSARGSMGAPAALPADRPYVPPPVTPPRMYARYEPDAFVAQFPRGGSTAPPFDEARVAPARRRVPTVSAPLRFAVTATGGVALWVDQDGDVDTVLLARVHCRR